MAAPYAAAHANPNGPGDARPTAIQIIKDNAMENKLVDKVAVVTGSSSGIGLETVRALALTGLKFFLPVRDQEKARIALGDSFNPERMEFVQMDQSSLASVRAAAQTILSKTNKINLLVNNAGIMVVPELTLTKDGFELQFATNHLSHFLLFQLLKPLLLSSSTPEFQSRVVLVSSDAHRSQSLHESDNYSFQKGGYVPYLAYGQSKTANVYMANDIERRYASSGLHATSLHPGVIATKLGRYMSEEAIQDLLSNQALAPYWKSPEQGAATTVWAAVGNDWEGKGGKYLSHCAVAQPGTGEGDPAGYTCAEHTYSPEGEARLWKDSLTMVGLDNDDK